MLAGILALFAAAAPAPPATPPDPGNTVSGVTVSAPPKAPATVGATVEVAGDDEGRRGNYVVIWPAAAYRTAVEGHVTLACKIDVHGLAEWCQVASQTPADKGFGAAALELRPTFKLEPAKGPDGAPVSAMMSIKVDFKPPDPQFDRDKMFQELRTMKENPWTAGDMTFKNQSNPLAMRDVTMLDSPVWVQAANFDDLARAYPAKGAGVEGYAAVHCRVERSSEQAGVLKACQIIKESPDGHDFGKAALGLAPRFRVDPAVLAKAPNRTALWVDVPIRLPPPAQLADRTVNAPIWLVSLDPEAASRFFPKKAAVNGLTAGTGVARCTVAADGSMADCEAEPGLPDGMEFSYVAARLATAMKMNLWSADGAPTEGGVVHIPIQLNLKPGPK
jgi:TonB family protein